MKATILSVLKSIGLKFLADYWESRGKDKIADIKDELIKFLEDRLDLIERQLKENYGIRESVRDYVLMRDQATKEIIKLYIEDRHIKNESVKDT